MNRYPCPAVGCTGTWDDLEDCWLDRLGRRHVIGYCETCVPRCPIREGLSRCGRPIYTRGRDKGKIVCRFHRTGQRDWDERNDTE